ncbi:class I adenylate-forming enzyme family protein [Phocaeicola massiliensis]|jgi:AMP-dependent synthetase/ligase|uniref:class I adenylate-forming enzyme family protein n=1 Tax=Phocaeicola massiliensis TaxID=204516 RepID=UPI0015B40B0E
MYSHSPLLCAVWRNAEMFPDKAAFIVDGVETSYSSLVVNVRKAAGMLVEKGLKTGDRIILSAHKDIRFIYVYLASHILGVTNVIVDAASNEERLRYVEERVKPKYCFGYKSGKCPSEDFAAMDLEAMMPYEEKAAPLLSEDSVAEILFTTGTTGNPKGACLSYRNIFASASNINEFIRNRAEDIEVLALPICHSFGLGRIRCNLLKGATVVLMGSFANVRLFFKNIEQYHATGFGVVPAAWAYIRKISGTRIGKYAEQIRYIEIGSAAMPLEVKEEMLRLFPDTRICMHYGLTESSRSAFVEFHDTKHLESVGKPVSSVKIKIMDENGKEVLIGDQGEICVEGDIVMSHYLDVDDDRNAFWGSCFRTGDYGYADKDGYIYLMGRRKELINVGGKKVSPIEVEDAVCSLGVGDCVCVAVPDKEGMWGERVKCYILRGSTHLTFEEIDDKLSSMLEVYKRPVEYEWIENIPMTASGKKQRIQLK